ncbi:hypothetical protein [uncultured Algibacter sp.]|uniref:hypothetical protein n=1 Tax=uncultured Algibacter sp. TaxID=298659 RepID=UPI003216F930
MLLLQLTFLFFFLFFVVSYLRINNTKEVLTQEDESDTVLFYFATAIHVIAIAVLFHSTHESLNSTALILNSYPNSFFGFWLELAPVYGKILLTIAGTLLLFTFLSRFFAKQTLKVTKALNSNTTDQEAETILIFMTSAIFLGLVIISYQFIETLAISYVPVLGGIN